jgi:hypothetical protein
MLARVAKNPGSPEVTPYFEKARELDSPLSDPADRGLIGNRHRNRGNAPHAPGTKIIWRRSPKLLNGKNLEAPNPRIRGSTNPVWNIAFRNEI